MRCGTNVLVVDHLHETELTERSLGIGLVLERLHQFLDRHLLPSLGVHCRASDGWGGGGGDKEGGER